MKGENFYTQFQCNDVNINVLLSFIAEGLVLFDRNGVITTLNPHASLLLDYTQDELVGKRFDDIIPVYQDGVPLESGKRITEQVAGGEVFSIPGDVTLYFEARGGRCFPVFVSAKPLWFSREDEDIEGGVLVFRDITIEKELEQYKENTAKTLSELTPILQKTATGDFTHYPELPKEENEFTELLVGLRLMLDDLRELDTARRRNEQEKINALEEKRALTEKYSKELEREVDRKTTELQRAKQHIETIIENLTTGLVEYDGDCRIVRLNKAAEEMLGVDEEAIIGTKITEAHQDDETLSALALVTFPERAESVRRLSRDVSGVDADVCELTITYPIERNLQIATVPVPPAEGADQGVLKVIRDVTRERLISRSKSEFISIAAHQLRTPLSAIKWSLNLLRNGDFGELPEEQKTVVTDAFDTNEKMIDLVNDLLNVARIEDGRFGYEFKRADFHKMVGDLVHTSQARAADKQLHLTLNDEVSDPLDFVFDEKKLSVALQNLIDNAIKYTPEGGDIVVVLKQLDDQYVQIEVRDSGVGVPKHQISRLFTKFFRAENVSRLPVSGSGLGLFITRNIIERHGGSIQVQSEEGEGTAVIFTVPLDESLIPAKDDVAASLYTQ